MRRLVSLWCAPTVLLAASMAAQVNSPVQAEPDCREVSPRTGQCIIYIPPPGACPLWWTGRKAFGFSE